MGSTLCLIRLSTGFDKQATAHGKRSREKDIKIVVDVVKKAKVLEVTEKRSHRMLPKFTPDPLHKLNRELMARLGST